MIVSRKLRYQIRSALAATAVQFAAVTHNGKVRLNHRVNILRVGSVSLKKSNAKRGRVDLARYLLALTATAIFQPTPKVYWKWSYKSRRDMELNKLRHSLIPDADTGICSVVRCQIAGIWPRRSDLPSRWARMSTCPSVSSMFEMKTSTIRSP